MKLRVFVLLAFVTVFCGGMTTCARADLSIAANGKSTYTIVTPSNAPTSLQDAATEFQKDIKIATGVGLPLKKDNVKVNTPIIGLGSTQQAKAAGISSQKMADESFRIVTKGGNLFILGPDTPDGGWTKNNGVSNGTANGVYTFLEDYLDVRWLMPGDIGRDVSPISTFTVENLDRTETPEFSLRHVTHLWDYATAPQYANVVAWTDHQKLGGATDWDFNHNWWRTINRTTEIPRTNGYYPWAGGSEPNTAAVKSLYAAHPEWFAMDKNGKRPFPKGHYDKLETTNPQLVRWFAEQAIKTMKASKRPIAFSLSPSDGSSTWSQSPESKALYDPNPDPGYDPESSTSDPSMSSLVLKWYHDIAQIVAKEYPQGRLTGYIYSTYIYPPQKVSAKLPNNFVPQIATSRAYGYGLYREDVQKYFRTVTGDWAKIVTGDWFYYDLPTQLLRQSTAAVGDRKTNYPGSTGLITPAAPEIVNFIFPQLLKSHINGANIYGVPSWSNGALSNYILAKMEWDPTLNANDLQKDWLHRAYGPAAGAAMEQFYAKLDGWFRDYYQTNEKVRYELPIEMLKDLYGAYYPEMEKLFLQAKAKPMTEIQKQRLQLIEDNLIVLQWHLRNLRYLPQNFTSPLQRNDAQISALIAKDNADFALFPGVTTTSMNNRSKPKRLPWKVQLSKGAPAAGKSTLPKWDDSQFLIYAAKDGDIRIMTQVVTNGAYFAAYEIKNQKGELVTSGIFNTATPIVIPAKAGESFMLTTPLRKPANFQLQVQNAAVAAGNLQDGTLYLSEKDAPVYVFYVPGKNPVGVIENENGAKIRKPYSDNIAQAYAESKFSNVRLLKTFDEGWLFSSDPKNDGLQRGVTKADFDDSSWTPISPLDWWQTQGFTDYHGPAWYRIKFDAPAINKGETARLYFGGIDGNAVVYLNGTKIGEHLLGPDFAGWDKAFTAVANRTLKTGENTLAVQVTSKNDTTASGIFKGVALIVGMPRK